MSTKVSDSVQHGAMAFAMASLLLPSSNAFADRLLPEILSAKLIGSGHAGATEAQGLDALFYNPANLARTPSIIGDIVLASPQIEASQQGVSIYKDISADKNMLSVVESTLGRPVSIGLQNVTGASFRRTAFALFQRGDLNLAVKNSPITGIPEAQAASSVRLGAAFGIGRALIGRSVFVGATGVIVQKAEAQLSVSALDAQAQFADTGGESVLNDALKRGVAVGAHIGLHIAPEDSSYPDVSVVARNIGMTYSVGGKTSEERPTAELQTVDVGMSLKPGTNNSTSRISVDVKDVLNKSQENIYKRLHIGAEINFSDVVGVLGGINQGYTTYGVFLNSRIARLDAGLFSEEMGKYPGDVKNRSYYARVTVGWTK